MNNQFPVSNPQSFFFRMSDWQKSASNFAEKHNLTHSPGVYAIDLLSELGEVAKEILLATAYGKNPTPQFDQKIAGELGDVLYTLCLLATAVNVDLEQALDATLQKYDARWQSKGDIGSGKN